MSDAPRPAAKFLSGDLMRHIAIMTASSSVGLMAIFAVDFVDLYFISLLGQAELAAAVGFAGSILFFTTSISIGLTIAMSALAARRIGSGDPEGARQVASSVLVLGLALGLVIGLSAAAFAPQLLELLGATGETRDLGARYLIIILPTMPILAGGMAVTGLLRAHGDARGAMNVTLSMGVTNAILDPIFIFGFEWGLEGAAWASVCARVAMFVTAAAPIVRRYGGFAPVSWGRFLGDLRPILAVAIPAMLTNVATPVGNAMVTRAAASFGDAAVAGYSVTGRLAPLAFCLIFALSGAVGPIFGQNFGAHNYDRVRGTLTKALLFAGGYVVIVWAVMAAAHPFIAQAFALPPEGGQLVAAFSLVVAPLFIFAGASFVANAAFNNLGRPLWSTWLNWGRNTLGVAPFVWLGADMGGAPGVLIGHALGAAPFGIIAVWAAYRLVGAYETGRLQPDTDRAPVMRPRPSPPFSSPRP